MKICRLSGLGVFLCLALCGLPARAQFATVSADSYVTTALPSTNFGTRSNLAVNPASTALIQFSLAGLPAGTTSAQVSKATLWVYVNRLNAAGTLSLAANTSAWSELGVTGASAPTAGTAAASAVVAAANSYIPFDVTALVQGWVTSPSSNNGVALTASTADVLLDSKENDLTGHAAHLDIVLVNQGPQGTAGAQGPAGPAGPQGLQGPAGPQGASAPANSLTVYSTNAGTIFGSPLSLPPFFYLPNVIQSGTGMTVTQGFALNTQITINATGTYYFQYFVDDSQDKTNGCPAIALYSTANQSLAQTQANNVAGTTTSLSGLVQLTAGNVIWLYGLSCAQISPSPTNSGIGSPSVVASLTLLQVS